MFIQKYFKITINDKKAVLDEQLYLFQNDRNIDLFFEITNLKFDFVRNIQSEENVLETTKASYSSVKLLKPNGEKIITPKQEIINDKIKFTIDDKLIDNFDEIGIYKLQIQLYDDQYGMITIPHVIFTVLEPIFEEDVIIDYSTGQIDLTEIGKSTIASDDTIINELNTRVTEYKALGLEEWHFGDIISSSRMNKINDNISDLWTEIEGIKEGGLDTSDLDASKISYINGNFKTVKDALDSLFYVNPSVNSLTSNIATTLEMGLSVTSVIFNWSYNKDIVSQIFNGITLEPNIRQYTYSVSFNTNKTFSLVGNDGKNTCSRNISFNFHNRRYWGISNSTDYNSSLIGLLSSELSNSKSKTFTVNATIGRYIYYAIPSRLGECVFSVGGFVGGFSKVATINHINNQGYSENYYLYKSDNASLGNTTVTVS